MGEECMLEKQLVEESIRQSGLPCHALRDLLSIGVCPRCIFRLFGVHGDVYSCLSLSSSLLWSVLDLSNGHEEATDCKVHEGSSSPQDLKVGPEFCVVCWGILQLSYDEQAQQTFDLVASTAQLVKGEGFEIDSFSLEVSVPPIILGNERSVWLYMKKRYGSESRFQDKFFSGSISVKDALRFSITKSLEEMLAVKVAVRSFHIRFTYTHSDASSKISLVQGSRTDGHKKQKRGDKELLEGIDASDLEINKESFGLDIAEQDRIFQVPPAKVNQPCKVTTLCYRTPVYVGGRYLKVRVKNLKEVGVDAWTILQQGEAEKQKQYAALVWISRSLEDEDLKCMSSIKEMDIIQRTPIRVLHRRSPLERKRMIHWMRAERIHGSKQFFILHLCTQAGTYIKEFVHGDLGRTHPNLGSILGCRAEILQLDVTDVKMDCFNS
ncbi:putative tRNA pseudouridine synthase Pus10 isoform X2 [Amborella trichopoda]|uniref:putative tRNA pseudouridine synthase Pus10 isoform X2 n=1 Tax=Amborella trichopoda TaxID=13333 RepID=UPI0009BE4240|nr:putative tRNA pseudouridine synthase Pus10 isoform X2 [Amborella trichopoda]|eukprot:XP_020520095.1 putative tRNA pseudouridine synthase Pus10 isoform X2 [Amborella trichopoda]